MIGFDCSKLVLKRRRLGTENIHMQRSIIRVDDERVSEQVLLGYMKLGSCEEDQRAPWNDLSTIALRASMGRVNA